MKINHKLIVSLACILIPGILYSVFMMLGEGRDGSKAVPLPLQTPSETVTHVKPVFSEPEYVGKSACVDCHQKEVEAWTGSHHDLAMQEVNQATVLGDFDQSEFEKDGEVTRFSKQGEVYYVTTVGPGGTAEKYRVAYVYGVFPLQQYLLELPGGRLQALSVSWDSRPQQEGGQRWFHLYPDQKIHHTEALHWSGMQQNWNFTCAECHSTNLDKNYDAQSDRYDTRWSELDVSCEACHGPASNHVEWAQQQDNSATELTSLNKGLTHVFNERQGVHWKSNAQTYNPQRSEPRRTETEIQTCAACHSRRAQLFEDDRKGQALMQSYLPSNLEPGLYHVDGQIDDEVYVYGSFLQSKMYAEGVTCSDCHNPHSLELKVSGNRVCLQCHNAEKFESVSHHFHQQDEPGSQCVDCHMPSKLFMQVDARRDHSFRIPRPDLSEQLGTPNACNQCHSDKSASWATDRINAWFPGPKPGHQQFAHALQAARLGAGDAEQQLVALLQRPDQPAIARATAAQSLGPYLSSQSLPELANALSDPDPLVRAGAVQAFDGLPAELRWQSLSPLLTDDIRVVRTLAASQLADISAQHISADQFSLLQSVVQEYEQAQKHNADTPASRVNLGNLYGSQSKWAAAQGEYQAAIKLDPGWIPAYINLADMHRIRGTDDEGKKILSDGIERNPDSAALYYSLGLLQIRLQDKDKALKSLAEAVQLSPENERYSYVYIVALMEMGQSAQARLVLQQSLKLNPNAANLRSLKNQLP
ncbi:multiheme c-type cytochrome [Ketobacter sp.]